MKPRILCFWRVLVFATTLGAATLTLPGCEALPTGPSLVNVVLDGISKRPTLANGDTSLCCCHVTGTATNRNATPLYVTITFSGFDVDGKPISKILYFIPDLNPGASQSIDAAGFVVPCNALGKITWEVKVRGLTYPPL